MVINLPSIDTSHITRYTALTTSVLTTQQLVRKITPDKRHGVKYWFKLTGATILGLLGGTFLANVTEEYLLSTTTTPTTNDSSAKTSTVTKQTDSTDM